MAISKILERGYVAEAVIPFGTTIGDSDLGNTKQVTLEPGTVILQHGTVITTAFNGTTPTLTLTDGTTAYTPGIAATAVGYTAGTAGVGKFYPSGGTLTASSTGTGTTAGQAYFFVVYLKTTGKVNEVITN